ncbi:MAG TPA: hypothetical protein VHY20_13540, partial [Pirellulales bacterium]|nr:hypothetical protein [Pirellulales bacterium]
ADAQQLSAGRLVRRIGENWELRPARKSKFNGIEFSLASNRRLTVDVSELDVAREGQKLTVRGRLFDPAAQTAMQVVQQGPGYFQDPFGLAEQAQAKLAAEAAAKAANGETNLVPMIFTCHMVILTSSDDFFAARSGKAKTAALPGESRNPLTQP